MALLNSFAADYLVRQKLAGKHLTFFILKQVAIPPPARLKERCPWAGAETYLDFLARRTLELVYTADDLHALREDQAALPGPFVWDRARRSVIRAEMDASIFHLYGLGPEDVEYIMSTFPVAESYEVKRDGEFTTKRLILERYARHGCRRRLRRYLQHAARSPAGTAGRSVFHGRGESVTESVGESSKATKSADEPKRIPGADGTASAAGKGRPAAHLLVIGEREALVWVLTEQRMAFPANRAREALALVPGDLLFIYTTRGCFHNPTRDPSRVIGEATVKSPVRPLKDAVVFGARAFPIGCRLSIKRCAPWGRGVELRPLVPKISAFPDPATWSARMRSALVPLGRDDVVLLRNALKSVVAEPRAVVPSYRAMLPHRAA